MKIFITICTIIIFSCAQKRTFTSADILIPIDKPLIKPPTMVSASEVKQDIDFVIYALDRGYAGRYYMPEKSYQEMIEGLQKIQGSQNTEKLRDAIDAVLLKAPDRHLRATLNYKRSELRKSLQAKGRVGANFYRGDYDHPWKVEVRNIKNKKVLFVSITAFPPRESEVWKGFLSEVEKQLKITSATILDMRGNDGGDDSTGMQMAWLFYGGNYQLPYSVQRQRQTPEIMALYANMFAESILWDIENKKIPPDFFYKNYEKRKKIYERALANKSEGYSSEDISFYEPNHKVTKNPRPYKKPIYILMDRACASSGESTIDAFENYPLVQKIGENTGGYVHFGNVSPVILPHSRVTVRMGTHFTEYKDKRFIEASGIAPNIKVPEGKDAMDFAIDLL